MRCRQAGDQSREVLIKDSLRFSRIAAYCKLI